MAEARISEKSLSAGRWSAGIESPVKGTLTLVPVSPLRAAGASTSSSVARLVLSVASPLETVHETIPQKDGVGHSDQRSEDTGSPQSTGSGSPCSPHGIKRKRPPQLFIPAEITTSSTPQSGSSFPRLLSANFDAMELTRDSVTLEGRNFALNSKRGRRSKLTNEDAFQVLPDLSQRSDTIQAMFSLFDGHGGRYAADFAACHLHENILSEVKNGDVSGGIIQGFLRTDKEFLQGGKRSGAAAVTALLEDGTLWVGHVGDCRAVLCCDGAAEALTTDHKPERPAERARIENQGGEVLCGKGAWRVQGVLGVSRAIGDRDLKPYVTALPDVARRDLEPNCEFLILATDGFWDVVSNQEAVDLAREILRGSSAAPPEQRAGPGEGAEAGVSGAPAATPRAAPQQLQAQQQPAGAAPTALNSRVDKAARALVDLSCERGSRDDISVLVVELPCYVRAARRLSGSAGARGPTGGMSAVVMDRGSHSEAADGELSPQSQGSAQGAGVPSPTVPIGASSANSPDEASSGKEGPNEWDVPLGGHEPMML